MGWMGGTVASHSACLEGLRPSQGQVSTGGPAGFRRLWRPPASLTGQHSPTPGDTHLHAGGYRTPVGWEFQTLGPGEGQGCTHWPPQPGMPEGPPGSMLRERERFALLMPLVGFVRGKAPGLEANWKETPRAGPEFSGPSAKPKQRALVPGQQGTNRAQALLSTGTCVTARLRTQVADSVPGSGGPAAHTGQDRAASVSAVGLPLPRRGPRSHHPTGSEWARLALPTTRCSKGPTMDI